MRLAHYITLGGAVALIAIIYYGGKTTPPKTQAAAGMPAKEGHGQPETGAVDPMHMGHNIQPVSFDSLLLATKAKLPAHAVSEVNAIETRLKATTDSTKMVADIDSLGGVWLEHKQLAVGAYYKAEAAKLENSEKKLNFAGQILMDLAQNEQAQNVQVWEAQEAIECFQQSLKINPKNDTITLMLASGLIEGVGETMQGVQLLLALVRENPNHVPANLMLGRMAVQSGQNDKAIGRFETVLKQDPNNTEALFFASEAYRAKGEKTKAIELLEKCKKIVNKPEFTRDIDDRIKSINKN